MLVQPKCRRIPARTSAFTLSSCPVSPLISLYRRSIKWSLEEKNRPGVTVSHPWPPRKLTDWKRREKLVLIWGHSLKTNTVIGGRFALPFLLLSPGVLELQTCVTVLGGGGPLQATQPLCK